MTTKAELVSFIRLAATEDREPERWDGIAICHYPDPAMESAHRKLVKEMLGYGTSKGVAERRSTLMDIAERLERS